MTEFCFAYGSNTDAEDWTAWCLRSGHDPACIEPAGTALLPDTRLAFDYFSTTRDGGALNLRERVGGVVEGVLLRVGATGWVALDVKEGVAARHYGRVARTAILADGSAVAVTAYEVVPERSGQYHPPTPAYLGAVRRGYRHHGIDPAPLDDAAVGAEGCTELAELFAYGTLMRGECRFPAASVTAVARACVRGCLHDLGDYPAMTLAGGTVVGDIMTLANPTNALPVLDAIEEARPRGEPGGLYRRTIIRTEFGQRAWAYVMNMEHVAGRPVIASGDWRVRCGAGRPA